MPFDMSRLTFGALPVIIYSRTFVFISEHRYSQLDILLKSLQVKCFIVSIIEGNC